MRRLLIGMIVFGLGLGSFSQPGPAITTAQAEGSPFRFVNLTDQTVDLFREGNPALFANEPAALSAERVITEAGEQTFAVFAANTNPESANPLAVLTLDVAPNTPFLLYAHSVDDSIVLETHNYDLSPSLVNHGRIEVLHRASAPPVGVAGQNGDVLLERIENGKTLAVDVPAGLYQASVFTPDTPQTPVLNATLDATNGVATTMVIYDGAEAPRAFLVSNNVAQDGLFRFAHAGRISPDVDLYLDDDLVFSGIAFGQSTEYVVLPTGDYTASLREAGIDDEVWSGNITISANSPLTGVALGENNFRLLTYLDDLQIIPAEQARVRVINAAFNVPLLTVRDGGDTPLVGGLEFALGSRNQNISLEPRTLTFRETDGIDLFTIEGQNFAFNHHYTFVVVGNAFVEDSLQAIVLDWNWQENPIER